MLFSFTELRMKRIRPKAEMSELIETLKMIIRARRSKECKTKRKHFILERFLEKFDRCKSLSELYQSCILGETSHFEASSRGMRESIPRGCITAGRSSCKKVINLNLSLTSKIRMSPYNLSWLWPLIP